MRSVVYFKHKAAFFGQEEKSGYEGRSRMNIYESGEDYLEQILMQLEKKGYARSVDIAEALDVSKPSVSVAMKKLRENGYIHMSTDNLISLTDKGYAIARKIYDRHQALTKFLVQIGVPEEIAREDACKIEHDLSEESFTAVCKLIR
jgi:Mn-dependent DtxR family transcriptional regulator